MAGTLCLGSEAIQGAIRFGESEDDDHTRSMEVSIAMWVSESGWFIYVYFMEIPRKKLDED